MYPTPSSGCGFIFCQRVSAPAIKFTPGQAGVYVFSIRKLRTTPRSWARPGPGGGRGRVNGCWCWWLWWPQNAMLHSQRVYTLICSPSKLALNVPHTHAHTHSGESSIFVARAAWCCNFGRVVVKGGTGTAGGHRHFKFNALHRFATQLCARALRMTGVCV